MINSQPDMSLIGQAANGYEGVMLKDSPPEQLLQAIRHVVNGQSCLHPIIARKLMQEVRNSAASTSVDDILTDCEFDVMKCLAQGLSNQEIALELSVSTRTVTTHVPNILDKPGMHNRTQVALYAVEHSIAKD